jgi:hypothetical protein
LPAHVPVIVISDLALEFNVARKTTSRDLLDLIPREKAGPLRHGPSRV